MRILHISSARTFGGGEKHLVDLSRGLTEKGHEIFLALRPSNEWQDRFDFVPPDNILHVSLRNSFGMFSSKRIARFIREHEIQIVHAHAARDYIPASLACRMAGNDARFVLTRHVLFPLKPFYRFAVRNLSCAIAVSKAVETNLRSVFPASRIVCIPNGTDVDRRAAADGEQLRKDFRFLYNIPFDVPLIGIVGELTELKGQREFVLAAQVVAESFPEARFIIVGKDNTPGKAYRRDLKRLVKVFGLEERFVFLDWVEETAPLLAALDVFVSASYTESFGLAIVEAMAGGTAIVSTATEGAKELIRDGETGLLVPIKDAAAIAGAVNDLLGNDDKRAWLGRNARADAMARFSLTETIENTEALYREILG